MPLPDRRNPMHLQYLGVKIPETAKTSLFLPLLKISVLCNFVKNSFKKVSVSFGWYVKSVYLCIRN